MISRRELLVGVGLSGVAAVLAACGGTSAGPVSSGTGSVGPPTTDSTGTALAGRVFDVRTEPG